MSFYETLYIVDPNLENQALEKTMDSIGKELEKTKSKIINHRFWGKKRLAYPVERQKYGSYIIMQFEGGDQAKMVDYNTWMKLNNSVLRHMTILLEEKPELYVEIKNSESEDENKKLTDDATDDATDDSGSEKESVVSDSGSENEVEEPKDQDSSSEIEEDSESKEVE